MLAHVPPRSNSGTQPSAHVPAWRRFEIDFMCCAVAATRSVLGVSCESANVGTEQECRDFNMLEIKTCTTIRPWPAVASGPGPSS